MKFQDPVFEGVFKKRYKRFFADVELDGQVVVAHTANTGSMKGLLLEDCGCRVTVSSDPKRKLKHTLQMLNAGTSWVGVNTHLPNLLVYEAWTEGRIPHWQKYKMAKREFKLSKETRLDMVFLENGRPVHFVEVKNVTMAEGSTALFPDSKTERGQKHLRELIDLQRSGESTEMVFVVQRMDCDVFSPAAQIDPEYARLLKEAHKAGVKISVYAAHMAADEITLKAEEPLTLQL